MMGGSLLAWIVTYWIHSAVLVLGAWLLERRWRERPERMSAVWKTALVGGVLTATVQVGLGIVPVTTQWALAPIPPTMSAGPVESAAAPGPATGVEEVTVLEPALASRPSRPSRPILARPGANEPSWPPPTTTTPGVAASVGPGALAPGAVVDSPYGSGTARRTSTAASGAVAGALEPPARSAGSWLVATGPWLTGLLLLGAVAGLLSVLGALVALRRQLDGRLPVDGGALLARLQQLQRRAGIGRRVPLFVAPGVQVPMAVGVLRPEIIVPPQAAVELSAAHQESLLAHELAHVLRRDPAWRVVALLVQRVLFFQPLNRLASARLAQTAEYLCDDWAARHTRQPLALASCLTEVATWVARPGPVAATISGPRSILGRRVHRLLQPAAERPRPPWLVAGLFVPLAGLVVAGPGMTTAARAHATASEYEPETARIVVLDEDGQRHELIASDAGLVVRYEDPGSSTRDDDGDEAGTVAPTRRARRRDRKASRSRERAIDRARRQARGDTRHAFRQARRRGDAMPSSAELEAIGRRARRAERAGVEPSPLEVHIGRRRESGPIELHIVGPGFLWDGSELGSIVEGLEQLEALEALEALEQLEALGPILEGLEALEGFDRARVRELERMYRGALEHQARSGRAVERALREAQRTRRHHDAARRQSEARSRSRSRSRSRRRRASEWPSPATQRHEALRTQRRRLKAPRRSDEAARAAVEARLERTDAGRRGPPRVDPRRRSTPRGVPPHVAPPHVAPRAPSEPVPPFPRTESIHEIEAI